MILYMGFFLSHISYLFISLDKGHPMKNKYLMRLLAASEAGEVVHFFNVYST